MAPMARLARRLLSVGKFIFVRAAALISAFLLAGVVFALDGILIGASEVRTSPRRWWSRSPCALHASDSPSPRTGFVRVGRARGADRRPGGDDGRAIHAAPLARHGLGMISA